VGNFVIFFLLLVLYKKGKGKKEKTKKETMTTHATFQQQLEL